jgi:aminoglycoside phosphotransferase (APT) family kinase protein
VVTAGFDSGPPDRVSSWASEIAGSPVVEIGSVTGGITATKWVLHLLDGRSLVLRWSDPDVWGEVGREHVRREASACRLLAGSAVPAPQLLASDTDGSGAGGFANLLTWIPGQTRLDRLGPGAVAAWAALAATVHAQAVPMEQRPPAFTFRGPARPQVPDWARWPRLWRTAIDLWEAGPPATAHGLLHRDFHLGNTLWQGDAVSGLVDWAESSWGPPDLDVAHACADLAMLHSVADVETFRTAYARHGGQLDPDPAAAAYWVIGDILGFLPDPAHILPGLEASRPDLTPVIVCRGLEDLLTLTLD